MEKYEKINYISEGVYGKVYKCRSKESGQLMAIKIFNETEDDTFIRKTAYREIKILKLLKHPNLVNLIEVFRRKKKLHFVFEFCDSNLCYELQKHYQRGYPQLETKRIIWQLLQALNFCHSKNVIHRDIKPENILLTMEGVVKLCDFGFARTLDAGDLTDYVATRWYRAPELLVGDVKYGSAVDVWAIGCVFAELVNGNALWPGGSDLDQIYQIRKNIGNLLPEQVAIFRHNDLYHDVTLMEPPFIEPLRNKMPVDFPKSSMDFLEKCVDKDPGKRWTCLQLLKHPYFDGFSYEMPKHEMEKFENISSKSPILMNSATSLPQLASSTQFQKGPFSTSSSPKARHSSGGLNRQNSFERFPNI